MNIWVSSIFSASSTWIMFYLFHIVPPNSIIYIAWIKNAIFTGWQIWALKQNECWGQQTILLSVDICQNRKSQPSYKNICKYIHPSTMFKYPSTAENVQTLQKRSSLRLQDICPLLLEFWKPVGRLFSKPVIIYRYK